LGLAKPEAHMSRDHRKLSVSTAETLYLLGLSNRLGLLQSETYGHLDAKYTTLIKGLKKLQPSLESGFPKPRA
jgi:hypothetical protein